MASVTRRPHSDRAARRGEIGRRLLVAVEKLLADGESFTEVSVERLVTEAGISRSTFYVYFEDKGDLLQALTADVMIEVIDAARAWWALPADADRASSSSSPNASSPRTSPTVRSGASCARTSTPRRSPGG